MTRNKTMRGIDTAGLLAKVKGEKKEIKKPEPKVEGPVNADEKKRTDAEVERDAKEKARERLASMDSKSPEEVSEDETTIGREEDEKGTIDGSHDEQSLLDEVDAEAEMPPPPPEGHTEPSAGEPREEAEVLDEEADAQEKELTVTHDGMQELPIDDTAVIKIKDGKIIVTEAEEEGEATQIYIDGLEEGEMTQEGFNEKLVTNKDLLKVLKVVDNIVEGDKREIEMLEGEKDLLEMKVQILDEDLGEVEGIVGDENLRGAMTAIVQEELGDEESKEMLVYRVLKGAPELLESALLKIGVVKKEPEKEEKEEEKEEEKPQKEGTPAEMAFKVLDVIQLAPEEGVKGETYIDALEKCEEEYGAEALKGVLGRLQDIPLDPESAKVVGERVDYVRKKFYSGDDK